MSVSSRGRFFAVIASILAFALPAIASAADAEEQKKNVARNYVIEGDEALEKGNLERALDRFERAERLIPAPTVRLRLARVYVKMGKLVAARDKYKQAAAAQLEKDAPDIFFRAVVEAQKEAAELEPKIPTLEITAPKGEGGAKLDGAPISNDELGKPMPVNPGHHVVSMPCCGEQAKDVAEGARVKLTFEPQKLGPQRTTNWMFVGGLGSIGVGIGGAVLGFVGYAQTKDASTVLGSVAQNFTIDENVCDAAKSDPSDARFGGKGLDVVNACSSGASGQLMELIGFPLAVVGVTAGIVLLVQSGGSITKPATSRVNVVPVVGREQSGVVVSGSF